MGHAKLVSSCKARMFSRIGRVSTVLAREVTVNLSSYSNARLKVGMKVVP